MPHSNLPKSSGPIGPEDQPLSHPGFGEACWVWIKIGLLSFGGPTGQIALMHRELVEQRRWISESRFLHALNYCMLLPGPEAQQLSIYVGWLLHRTWGGIVAGASFVLPGALLLWGVSYVYVVYGKVPLIESAFYGLKPAVMAIVAAATIRIGSKALRNGVMWSIAALAFVAIFFFRVPFPAIIAGALLIGWIGSRWYPAKFAVATDHNNATSATQPSSLSCDRAQSKPLRAPSLKYALVTSGTWLVIWWVPILLLYLWVGSNHVLFREGTFFSKAAVITFGGAYAVLPYVAEEAVKTHAWLSAAQMVDGLALAETTPGPLILVLQFVGFLGAWNYPGKLSPFVAATMGSAITLWATFIPGFLFVFVGAPFVEKMRGNVRLSAVLTPITAAVVGVIMNLAVWFALTVIMGGGKVDWISVALAVLAFLALQRLKWDVIVVVVASGLAGVLLRFFGL